MVHGKAIVVDGAWVDIGSTNFTPLSHGGYEEVDLFCQDAGLAEPVEEAIEDEIAIGQPAQSRCGTGASTSRSSGWRTSSTRARSGAPDGAGPTPTGRPAPAGMRLRAGRSGRQGRGHAPRRPRQAAPAGMRLRAGRSGRQARRPRGYSTSSRCALPGSTFCSGPLGTTKTRSTRMARRNPASRAYGKTKASRCGATT